MKTVLEQAAPAALPPGCKAYRSSPVFTEATVPPALLRSHRTAPGTWALIHVLEGRLLYRALGAEPPTFAHVPLLLDLDGERMAKRKGSLTVTALRAAGVRPERVVGLLAYTLRLQPGLAEADVQDFVPEFDLKRIGREAFRLEPEHLEWLYRG